MLSLHTLQAQSEDKSHQLDAGRGVGLVVLQDRNRLAFAEDESGIPILRQLIQSPVKQSVSCACAGVAEVSALEDCHPRLLAEGAIDDLLGELRSCGP